MKNSSQRSNSQGPEKIYLNWNDYNKKLITLINIIKKNDVKFDFVYGIPRGGLIPAVFISHQLEIDLLINLNSSLNKLKDKKIFIIDDIVDTGITMIEIINLIKLFNIKLKVFSGSIFKHKKSNFIPDFYVEENDKWIIFPYERVN